MSSKTLPVSLLTLAIAFFVFAGPAAFVPTAQAQPEQQLLNDKDIISGEMLITFNTRTQRDTSGTLKDKSPAIGASDQYQLNLKVTKILQFNGEINRQPNLYTKTLHSLKQPARLFYNIFISVLNPKDLTQRKQVGKWVGEIPIDTTSGAYDLAGGKASESPLKIAIDAVGSQAAFTDMFEGKLIGKAEKKDNLASYTYKRLIGDKSVEVVVKKVDPMKFEQIKLAKGPVSIYPPTVVNGRLDYDYDTSNWLTDGIEFTYNLDGKEVTDRVTGSIKWVDAPDRSTSGKGHYEFNLRFNEAQNKTTEADLFKGQSDENAFFVVDTSVPSLTGTIDYVDTFGPGGDKEAPVSSKVDYHLNANKLTKQQVVNFFKLWMIVVGPTNDE